MLLNIFFLFSILRHKVAKKSVNSRWKELMSEKLPLASVSAKVFYTIKLTISNNISDILNLCDCYHIYSYERPIDLLVAISVKTTRNSRYFCSTLVLHQLDYCSTVTTRLKIITRTIIHTIETVSQFEV